ncbi:MAG: hypothetical protein AB1477_00505 [Acidobacteriota bacterium]|jgi:hypothetical protein
MMNSKNARDSNYVRKLEGLIRQMLEPLKGIPFTLVIESISGKRVIPFDQNKHSALLTTLIKVSKLACKKINEKGGVLSARVNEVGNKIEAPIKDALRELGFSDVDTPVNAKGKKQATGYPDLGFTFDGLYVYLECKSFNKKNVSTTQRSFYLSPSEDFKVTKDAIHVLISIEVERTKYIRVEGQTFGVYRARGWKIIKIENIDVDVKREFNADNKRMYAKENILAEGRC